MDNDMGVARRKPCDFLSGAPAGRARPPGGPCKRMAYDGPPGGRPLPASLTMQKTKLSPDNPMPPGRAAVPGRRGAWGHAPSLHDGSAIIHGQHNKEFSWDGSPEKNREKSRISRDCKRKGSPRAGFGRAVASGGLREGWKGGGRRRAAREKFSNGWKHFFQSLENRQKIFPIIGKNGRIFPTIGNFFSNHWKTSARARARENSCFRGGIW